MGDECDFFLVLFIGLLYEKLIVPHKLWVIDSRVSEIVRRSKQVFAYCVPFGLKIGHNGLEVDRGAYLEPRVDEHEGFRRSPFLRVDMDAFFFFEGHCFGVEIARHGFDPAIQGSVGQ